MVVVGCLERRIFFPSFREKNKGKGVGDTDADGFD